LHILIFIVQMYELLGKQRVVLKYLTYI